MEPKARILVVDDEVPVCKSISSALEPEGYAVDMALSGEEALKKEAENGYDVMLVDLMMPGMSGMELLQAIKGERPDVMVIMITGYPTMKTAVQAVKLGAFDYLPKPFTPRELRVLVSRALGRMHLEVERSASGAEQEVAGAREILPSKDIYCIPGHSWMKVEQDGNARIGVHETFLMTVRSVSSIEFPYENERVGQGEACLWLVDANQNLHRVWSPLSGQVLSVNEGLKKDPSTVLKDPYGSGWMLLIKPERLEAELENLVPFEQE